MKISILIPVYNVEKYLSKCLESILSQDFNDYEIIMVNDGSTDTSGDICDSYTAKYPDKITCYHSENKGLLLTRRELFTYAKGEYIWCVDSDDMIFSGSLSKLVDVISKHSPEVIMFGMKNDFQVYSNSKLRALGSCHINKNDAQYELINSYQLNNMCSKCIKTDKIDLSIDFSHSGHLNLGEDLLQCLYIFDKADNFFFLDEYLYFYRENPKSITRSYNANSFSSISYVACQKLDFADKWNVDFPRYHNDIIHYALNEMVGATKSTLTFSQKISVIKKVLNNPLVKDSQRYFDWKSTSIKRFVFLNILKFFLQTNKQNCDNTSISEL